MMRYLFLTIIFSTHLQANDAGVKGKVISSSQCGKKAMVWLSLDESSYEKRLLLMHTMVPVGGTFQFYLKAGEYELRGSDDQGCGFIRKIKIGRSISSVDIRMTK
jgi:hypothetical protein